MKSVILDDSNGFKVPACLPHCIAVKLNEDYELIRAIGKLARAQVKAEEQVSLTLVVVVV